MAKWTYMKDSHGRVWTTSHPEYHKDCEQLSQAEGKRQYREQCKDELRKLLKPGDTVWVHVNHVSGSGMSRNMSCYIVQDGRIRNISSLVATAVDWREGIKGGIVVSGCGMDMGFHLVYTLGRVLWPEGFGAVGKMPSGTEVRPMSREHAAILVEGGADFRGRNGGPSGWDGDGGYALQKEWL